LTLQVIALGAAGSVVVGVWSAYQENMEGYRQYQKRDGEDQKKTAEEIAQRCAGIDQINPALRECIREAIVGYQKTQHNDRDLQAQQQMAFWALVAAIIAACSLFVSIVGLGFIWQSLKQTRTAITNDREIGEAQVRAYLTVEIPDNHSYAPRPGKPFSAELHIKNAGQSPALRVRHLAGLMPLEFPLAANQGDLLEADPASIEQGSPIVSQGISRIEAKLEGTLTQEQIDSILAEGKTRLFAVVIVTYFDVFQRQERITKFCAYLTKGKSTFVNAVGTVVSRHEWALANTHNEAT
jgi:hypothetical protein